MPLEGRALVRCICHGWVGLSGAPIFGPEAPQALLQSVLEKFGKNKAVGVSKEGELQNPS